MLFSTLDVLIADGIISSKSWAITPTCSLFVSPKPSFLVKIIGDIFKISSEVIQCDAEVCPKNYEKENYCDIVRLHINGDVIAAIGACDDYNDGIMQKKSEDEAIETSQTVI